MEKNLPREKLKYGKLARKTNCLERKLHGTGTTCKDRFRGSAYKKVKIAFGESKQSWVA